MSNEAKENIFIISQKTKILSIEIENIKEPNENTRIEIIEWDFLK